MYVHRGPEDIDLEDESTWTHENPDGTESPVLIPESRTALVSLVPGQKLSPVGFDKFN